MNTSYLKDLINKALQQFNKECGYTVKVVNEETHYTHPSTLGEKVTLIKTKDSNVVTIKVDTKEQVLLYAQAVVDNENIVYGLMKLLEQYIY